MAVTTVTSGLNQVKGVKYTVITDSSSDWTSVGNDVYFYDKATSLPYYKNAGGTVVSIFEEGGGGGKFGISNTDGEYTYYTTIQLALAAASSGDVIEQFANVSVSTASSITLDKDITWNMNGYEYKNTSTSSFVMLDIPTNTTVNITFINGKFTRNTGSTNGGTLLDTGNYTGSKIKSYGVTFENLEDQSLSGGGELTGGTFRSSGTPSYGIIYTGVLRDVKIYSSKMNRVNGASCRLYNCYFYSSGERNYIYSGGVKCYDCVFESDASYGIHIGNNANELHNCIGRSSVSAGIYCLSGNLYNCTGTSTASIGIQLAGVNAKAYNCVGGSSSASIYGFYLSSTSKAFNCTAISSGSYAVGIQNDGTFKNGTAISEWDDAGGHGIVVSTTTSAGFEVTDNTIEVANASANGLRATVALSYGKWANNTFKGMTISVNSTNSNQIVNTQDNKGNILI